MTKKQKKVLFIGGACVAALLAYKLYQRKVENDKIEKMKADSLATAAGQQAGNIPAPAELIVADGEPALGSPAQVDKYAMDELFTLNANQLQSF